MELSLVTMDLEDVRVFLHVAKLGSFTKAAQSLSLPKSTVSRRVSELEDSLRVRLLHRTTRKLSLTEAGQLYFQRTAHILDELSSAEIALEEMQTQPRGVVRVTIPGGMSGAFAVMARKFGERFPDVRLVVFATGRRVDLVAEGYDLAVRAGHLTDSSLISKKLTSTPFGLLASPDYLARSAPLTSPQDLTQHQCLVFGLEGTEGVYKLFSAQTHEEIPVRGPLSSNDLSMLKAAAVAGLGVALLPLIEASPELNRGTLVRVLPEVQGEEGIVYAVYPSSRHLPPRVRAFIDFLSDWMADEYNLCATAACVLECDGQPLEKTRKITSEAEPD